MANLRPLDSKTVNRSLLAGAIIFAVMCLVKLYAVPYYPVLDELPFTALVAAAVAAVAWWLAFRARNA